MPAGGFRMPATPETAVLHDSGEGNVRALDNLVMDGSGVFNFVMVDVPPMIEELLKTAGVTDADVEAYAFHQPNKFMLQKLAADAGAIVLHDLEERGLYIRPAATHAATLQRAIETPVMDLAGELWLLIDEHTRQPYQQDELIK